MLKNHKKFICILVVSFIFLLTIGYTAFGSQLFISEIVADVRIKSDIRITNVEFVSANNGGINDLNYDVDSVIGNINLESASSTITLQVSITNFGNQEMGIWNITGLSNNLVKTLDGYTIQDKLCDGTGACMLGSTTTFNITIGYDSYDAVTKDHEMRLDFEFREIHQITYTGISGNYPTSVIDGGSLTFTTSTNVVPKIVAFTELGDRFNYNLYSYVDGVFKFNNVTDDINLKYQEKAYLKTLSTDIDFKESTYKTVIDSVQFVDYVDTSNAVKIYDLSEKSGSKDVVGWITPGNDLYIGSEWEIYGKSFTNFFDGMSGIREINFNNFNTSETTTMYYMFKDCSSLVSLDVSSFDTSNVTNMGSMFQGLSKITSLDLSNFNTAKVEKMHGMFRGMTLLSGVNVSSFDTSNVNNMSDMFRNTSVISLDLSNFNTSNVTTMYAMFGGTNSLTTLNISNFDTSRVSDMREMFSGTALETLDLSHLDTKNVTKMDYMFNYALIRNLNINGFNTSKVTSMSNMFAGLRASQLDVSSFDTANVTNMSYMFGNMIVTNIYVGSGWNTSKVTQSSNMFLNSTNLPNFDSSVVDVSKAYVGAGGYLNYPLVEFTVEGRIYYAEEGMTWGEWLDSDYNTAGFYYTSCGVTGDRFGTPITDEYYNSLDKDSIIDSSIAYIYDYEAPECEAGGDDWGGGTEGPAGDGGED